MKQLKCEVGDCYKTLLSPSEVAIGICSRHQKQLDGPHAEFLYYAVVCWQCNKILSIERPLNQNGDERLIKDKYIMTKSCPKCNELSDGQAWMNHPSPDEKSEVVLGKGMTLHPAPKGLRLGKKLKISHINPRRVKATGTPLEKGHDIIRTIKISKDEADKRLNNFLNNLELDEGTSHGDESYPS